MKLEAITLSIIFAIMSITPVEAGGRHRKHSNHHYRGHGHHYRSGHHYRRRHYNHYSYGHRGYYGFYYYPGHYAAYALGGLIVGGVIGATIANAYNTGARSPNYKESINVNSYPSNSAFKPSYIVQPDGNCYVISHVNNGRLVLAPVSPGNCQ